MKEEFTFGNLHQMDPMHDSDVFSITVKNNKLVIVYEDLLKGVLTSEGKPYYKYDKLVVQYYFESFMEARLECKNKYRALDITEDMILFNKLTKDCYFESYKYCVDSFNTLYLCFGIHNKKKKSKYDYLVIHLDAKKVEYCWE